EVAVVEGRERPEDDTPACEDVVAAAQRRVGGLVEERDRLVGAAGNRERVAERIERARAGFDELARELRLRRQSQREVTVVADTRLAVRQDRPQQLLGGSGAELLGA